MNMKRHGSYGIDAPSWLVVPFVLIVGEVIQGVLTSSYWPFVGPGLILVCIAIGLHSSRRGKFAVWNEQLASLSGDEEVLDLGCGRGAVLMTAARHLTTGRAVGIDIWRGSDQSGNCGDATRRNAVAEGVADRVEVMTADMTALPFPDASFDVVVSSGAVHNVGPAICLDRAIDEAVRVLRPGGRVLIADLWHTRRYQRRLEARGLRDVRRHTLGWRMWWSGPWLPTVLVSAKL
jgi:cyclopropane fatty-acyl-phospholipid synthase-like methyltransferase